MTQALDAAGALIISLGALVMQAIGSIDAFLRDFMIGAGVGSRMQDIVLVIGTGLFIVVALRVFGGLLRFLVVVFLIMLVMHVMLSGNQIPGFAYV